MKGYVYILESLKDHNKYIGSTYNITRRLSEHNAGLVRSTKSRKPFRLLYRLKYDSVHIAAQMEKKFKKSHNSLERELKRRGVV